MEEAEALSVLFPIGYLGWWETPPSVGRWEIAAPFPEEGEAQLELPLEERLKVELWRRVE